MSPYTLLVNREFKFELVDTRQEIDYSQYIGTTTSTWKKVVTAGQRRYNSRNVNLHSGQTYILTYEKGQIVIVNPGKGDYIPPGYERVSRPLEELFRGWDGSKCVNRSRIVPMPGSYLFNPEIRATQNQFCIYRNQPQRDYVKGWTLFTNNQASYYCYIQKEEAGGIKCRNEGDTAMATQTICKEALEGKTSLRIRCRGTHAVILGTEPMIHEPDGTWTWEGEPITEDTMLTIEINSTNFSGNVEFLDD